MIYSVQVFTLHVFAEMAELVLAEKDRLASQMHGSFANCNIPNRIAQLIDKRIKGYRIRKALWDL